MILRADDSIKGYRLSLLRTWNKRNREKLALQRGEYQLEQMEKLS